MTLIVAVAVALCVGAGLGLLFGREERNELRQDVEARDTVLRFVLRTNEELARATAAPAELEAARLN